MTFSRIRDLLRYEPNTGVFIRRVDAARMKAGDVAGGINNALGYVQISIDGKREYAHRVAWLYMTGDLPPFMIDHINGNKADNRWANLRLANKSQNAANSKRRSDSSTGLKGVLRRRDTGRFTATVRVNGRNHRLGCFDCPAAAHFAYIITANKMFGQFARMA